MNRKIILSLASVACLASCNNASTNPTKDLTPVDDAKGIQVAKKILVKQLEMWGYASSDNPDEAEKAVAMLPHKFTMTDTTIINGKEKTLYGENIYDNVKVDTSKAVLDYDLAYLSYDSALQFSQAGGYVSLKGTYYFYYNSGDKTIYTLFESGDIKLILNKTPNIPDILAAKKAIGLPMYFACPIYVESPNVAYTLADYLTGMNYQADGTSLGLYLQYITMENEIAEGVIITALDIFKSLQDTLAYYQDNKQYYNWQFGSDDDASFSLRNTVSFDRSEVADKALYKGYGEGMAELAHYGFASSIPTALTSYPDLVVFKNNFLSSAEFKSDYDLTSIGSKGTPDDAFYKKLTRIRNVDFDYEKAEVTYPDLSKFVEMK